MYERVLEDAFESLGVHQAVDVQTLQPHETGHDVGRVAVVRSHQLCDVRRVVTDRRRRDAPGRGDHVESAALVGDLVLVHRDLARVGVEGDHRHRGALLPELLRHVLVDLAREVDHDRRGRVHLAAVVAEPPQRRRGLGRAVGRLEAPPEERHLLLGEVLRRVVARAVTDDGEHLVLRHQLPRFRQRRGRVVLVVREPDVVELEALDLLVVVESLDPRLRPDLRVAYGRDVAQRGDLECRSVESTRLGLHRGVRRRGDEHTGHHCYHDRRHRNRAAIPSVFLHVVPLLAPTPLCFIAYSASRS